MIMNIIRKIIYTAPFLLFPVVTLAASQPRTLVELINRFVEILRALIPLLFGIALIGFLWGVAQFILNADNEEKRREGKKVMIWGIIGLFVMLSVWGLVAVIGGTFGIGVDPGATPQFPGGFVPSQDYLQEGFDPRGI